MFYFWFCVFKLAKLLRSVSFKLLLVLIVLELFYSLEKRVTWILRNGFFLEWQCLCASCPLRKLHNYAFRNVLLNLKTFFHSGIFLSHLIKSLFVHSGSNAIVHSLLQRNYPLRVLLVLIHKTICYLLRIQFLTKIYHSGQFCQSIFEQFGSVIELHISTQDYAQMSQNI